MPNDNQEQKPLHLPLLGLRVLEVGDMVAAPFCCKLLASLGAEVIKAEPPRTGDQSRRLGPFPDDVPHNERSGLFLYLNTGKKGITLDLSDPQGRVLLHELAQTVDAVVHDRQPAQALAAGLADESLANLAPSLVVAALTPFGANGPNAEYRAHDINIFHAGGEGYLLPNGLALESFPDRAPVTAGSRMGSFQGGVTAAVGIVAAMAARHNGTGGQYLDCSLQEGQLMIGYLPIQRLETEGVLEDRFSRFFRIGGTLPAQDGYVEMLTVEPGQWESLLGFLERPQWASPEAYTKSDELGSQFNSHLREWTGEHTREWLYRQGQAMGVPVAPYYTPSEVFHNSHTRERGGFVPVDHPEVGQYEYFATPFRLNGRTGTVERAPLLGEHNLQVYGSLGYSAQDVVALARAGAV